MLPPLAVLERTPVVALICAPVILTSLLMAWAERPETASMGWPKATLAASPGGVVPAEGKNAAGQIREGTEVSDLAGTFRLVDQRALFTGGSHRFMVLENLGLERVVRTMLDTPGELEWVVSGTVTEYRGTNYLLLRRAVLRGRTSNALSAQRASDSLQRR